MADSHYSRIVKRAAQQVTIEAEVWTSTGYDTADYWMKQDDVQGENDRSEQWILRRRWIC